MFVATVAKIEIQTHTTNTTTILNWKTDKLVITCSCQTRTKCAHTWLKFWPPTLLSIFVSVSVLCRDSTFVVYALLVFNKDFYEN